MLQKHSAAAKNLVGDTERFKTGCFSNTWKVTSVFVTLLPAVFREQLIFLNSLLQLKLLRNFPWAFLFFQCSGKDARAEKVWGNLVLGCELLLKRPILHFSKHNVYCRLQERGLVPGLAKESMDKNNENKK